MNKLKKRAHFNKERSDETVSTRLWEADHALFSETVGRRRTTPAELLRQIVHEWAITMRLSGQNSDEPETAAPIRKLDEQILAEQLAPINQTLAAISQRLNVPLLEIANTQDGADPASDTDSVLMAQMRRVTEDMETVLEQLSRLRMFTIAHYNLSAQIYAGNWAVLVAGSLTAAAVLLAAQGCRRQSPRFDHDQSPAAAVTASSERYGSSFGSWAD